MNYDGKTKVKFSFLLFSMVLFGEKPIERKWNNEKRRAFISYRDGLAYSFWESTKDHDMVLLLISLFVFINKRFFNVNMSFIGEQDSCEG